MSQGEGKTDPMVVTFDWAADRVALVKQAAAQSRLTFEGFVRKAAEAEAARVLKSRKDLMDLNAVAAYLGVARTDVVKLISEGRLVARKIDDEWMVDKASANAVNDQNAAEDLNQIALDLRAMVGEAGLTDLDETGVAPESLSASWCYVGQDGVLHCPRAAWRSLGRDGVLREAGDAVRRYRRRKERE